MRQFKQINHLPLVHKSLMLVIVIVTFFAHSSLFANELAQQEMMSGLIYQDKSGQQISVPLLNSAVNIDVNGLISRVIVTQTFENSSDDWINAHYLFPLPENAAVDHLRMLIGERVIIGEIKAKKIAKKAFEKAKREGKKASLIEQQRNNIFTSQLSNIGPGETIKIEIEYQHSVSYKRGEFSLHFPMTITPRYAPPIAKLSTEQRQQLLNNLTNEQSADQQTETQSSLDELLQDMESQQLAALTVSSIKQAHDPDLLVDIKVNINNSLGVKAVSSPYHQIRVQEQDSGSALVELANNPVIANQEFVLNWKVQQSEQANAAFFTQQSEQHNQQFGLLMLMPPESSFAEVARISKEVIFVIDVSGSMSGTSIKQAKQALLKGIEQLGDNDTFNIISFNDSSEFFANNSLPVDARSLTMAKQFISQLQASGGTNMQVALKDALLGKRTVFANQQTGLRQIVFISDASISNEEQLLTQITKQLGHSRLFMVGIGSAINNYFLKTSSKLGRGTYIQIADVNEVDSKMSILFEQLSSPVLSDIEINWGDGSKVDFWPMPIADLYQGEPLQVVFNIPEGKQQLSINATRFENNQAQQWHQLFDIKQARTTNSKGIDVLWAKEKIDSIDLNRQFTAQQKQQKITDLGLQFHIVTKHTSLLAIEQKVSRPEQHSVIDKQVKTHLPKGNTMRLPQTGLASLLYQQIGAMLLLLVSLCWLVEHYYLQGRRKSLEVL